MKTRWILLSILGLMLIASGLCVFGEALTKKMNEENYFWLGTLSLVIFNSGICIFGQSIIVKINSKHKDGHFRF